MPLSWDRASLAVVVGLCVAKALAHLMFVNGYGYHGDELHFIECGRHLAFGYVDHPPLIPWIARLADELGRSRLVLRMPAIAAGTGTMVFTALLVRDWGDQRALAGAPSPSTSAMQIRHNSRRLPSWATFDAT